ncbi:24705_t:CDS:2 [Entrophospora sp. SA101]|nr:10915_t:CDS:2 [Entrophospora sp. SA101]CAJ0748029.1 24705_t:CDS:2 [Entrophospora sp. SA101]
MSNYIKLAIGVNREGRAFFAQTDSDLIVQINVQHNGDLQTQLLEDNFISPGWKLTQYHDLGPQTTISSFRQSFDFNYLYEIRAMRKIVYLLFNKSLVNKLLQEWRNISWKEKILLTICTIVDATGIVADDMHAFVNNLKSKTKKNAGICDDANLQESPRRQDLVGIRLEYLQRSTTSVTFTFPSLILENSWNLLFATKSEPRPVLAEAMLTMLATASW